MGTGGPFSKRVQYSDGRIETILVPSGYEVGTVLAITHRKDGGVIAQRVSQPWVSGGIEISTKWVTDITPGATSQIRFMAKMDYIPPSTETDYIFARVGWWYGNAYDEHYSTEYDMPLNGSELSTDWAQYSTPEFICPYGNEITWTFAVYLWEQRKNRLPVYFDSPEILIGETWVPLAGWSWTEELSTDGWFKYWVYGDIDADISDGYLKIYLTS